MPFPHDIGTIPSGQLISNGKQAYIEADMPRTKTTKNSPSIPTTDQILTKVISATGTLDPTAVIELIEKIPLPSGMSKDAWRSMIGETLLAGLALGRAERENSVAPTAAEAVMKALANSPDAATTYKALRTKARITQNEIAERAGVVRGAVTDWESGRALLPSKAIRALCDIMASRANEPPLLTGNDVANLRKHLGISRATFAAAVGAHEVSIFHWEKFGDRPLTRSASAKVHKKYETKLAELTAY